MKSCTSSQVDFARNKDEWGVGQRMTSKKYILTSRERRCAVWIVPSTQVRQRSMMAGDTVWKWPNKSILGEGGGAWNPLSLRRKKLMMRTHFQTVADRSEGGDIQHLLLTWKLASIWMIFFWFNQAFICQVWPYSHDETRVLPVCCVGLVVVLQVHTQSKLVQGDARVHLDYEELNLKSCDKEGGVVFQNSLAILEQSFQILWNQTEPEKHFVPSTEAATAPSSRRTTQTWSCKPVHRDS